MDKRNATRSWSGYIHQGRVGLLIALRQLRNLISNGEISEITDYNLVYENAEDFDIQKKERVISRHQVKCYKDGTTMSAYKNVLSIQKRTYANGNWTLDQEGFQINDYKSDGSFIENVVDENSRYLHTIKDVPGFGLPEEKFKEWKSNNSTVAKNLKYYENFNNIQLYEYEPGKKYCEFQPDGENNHLRNYCLREIEAIIELEKPYLLDDPGTLEHRYNQLLDILDIKIYKCHVNEDGINYPMLSFQELLESVVEDKHIEPCVLRNFRKLISRYWDQYLNDWIDELIDFPEQICDADFERVQVILDMMARFTDDELKVFINQIQPTKKGEDYKMEILDLNSLCTESQMKQIFFKVLLQVKEVNFSLCDVTYNKDGGYVLSLINQGKTEIRVAAKNIIESRTLLQNIYEKDYLINQFIDDATVLSLFKDDRVLNAANNWDVNNDIIKKMDIRNSNLCFISVPSAIDKLNGETNGKLC